MSDHDREIVADRRTGTALAAGSNAQRIDMLSRITDLFLAGAGRYSRRAGQPVRRGHHQARDARSRPRRAPSSRSGWRRVPNAPGDVIRMLAFDDDIEVARPVLEHIGTARRCRPARQCAEQEPASPRGHLRAQIAERGGHRRAGDARRPAGRPLGRPQRRRALLRCRLPHAGEAVGQRRGAGDAGRRAPRPAAPAFPAPARAGFGRRARTAGGREPERRRRGRRRAQRGRRRHPQRDPQGFRRLRQPPAPRSRRSARPAASARPRSIASRARAGSRRPPSRSRCCPASRSTSSSARCTIAATRWR